MVGRGDVQTGGGFGFDLGGAHRCLEPSGVGEAWEVYGAVWDGFRVDLDALTRRLTRPQSPKLVQLQRPTAAFLLPEA